jgi:hypothetical protein
MPRASGSTSKRQSGAGTQRDNKHENGLVPPAQPKRVAHRKSQGQLQGSARSVTDPATGHAEPPSSPPRPSNTASTLSQQASANASASKQNGHYHHGNHDVENGPRRISMGNCSDSSEDSAIMGTAAVDSGYRQIDVNAMKNSDVHRDSGPLELATTVLRSLPMQDTLAILIILMHVPSVSITFVYTAFTCLTFVPPVTTHSGMNINFAEIFDGNASTPSLITVLCMDFFFFLFWLFLWQPLQDAILDLAKPVIAITLGGGTGSRDGSSRGLTTCFIWVLTHHLLRRTKSHWGRLVRHIPEHWPIPTALQDSLEASIESTDRRVSLDWAKSLLAIHILTQGIVRYVKEWYLRREKVSASSALFDPEAAKGQGGTNESTSTEFGFSTPDTESGALVSAPTMSKKKRKQSTQVRLQQPLWAALASTKIVVMKEYELSQTAQEQAGSNATDVHNLGNAPFESLPAQIWISYVGSDEVCFNTSHFPDPDSESQPLHQTNGHARSASAGPMHKPFYVRINNAYWQPTRMFPLEDETEEDKEREGTRWTGDIYGLRPASKYVCEFVDMRTDEILLRTSIRTVRPPQRETEIGSPSIPNGQRSLRPDSPATTLKTSIEAAEARLAEERNRLKTARKESKARVNNLKKDIELTDNQLASAGNNDEKYRQKSRQQETQKSQAEREIETLTDQIKNFDTAPELGERKKKEDRAYNAEKSVYDAAKKEFESFKRSLDKEVKAKEAEKSNLMSKATKIRTRVNKIETELANITDANNRGLDEAERQRQERASWAEHMTAIEANYRERVNHTQATNNAKIEQIQALQTQLSGFGEFIHPATGVSMDMATAAEQGLLQFSSPLPHQLQPSGPWNMNPAAAPHIPVGMWGTSTPAMMPAIPATAPSPSNWRPPPTAAPFEPSRGFKAGRGRSSSMLSDVSGFTQSSDEAPVFHNARASRLSGVGAGSGSSGRASGSSSSATGSGSGSVGDPASPV